MVNMVVMLFVKVHFNKHLLITINGQAILIYIDK